MEIREATPADVAAMSDALAEIFAAGKRANPGGVDFVRTRYIEDTHRLRCSVAVDAGRLLGFQSLKTAHSGNEYDTPAGWGIIGTHIRPSAARMGVGKSLFARSLEGARAASMPAIEAYIAAGNEAALAYYEAMGFGTWREPPGIICKKLELR
jgi:GNAT superfamily N-acetyltransferase